MERQSISYIIEIFKHESWGLTVVTRRKGYMDINVTIWNEERRKYNFNIVFEKINIRQTKNEDIQTEIRINEQVEINTCGPC